MVGPSVDKMKKYSFDEGRIVELNNQAKHYVKNNMESEWRIHLIFDYVDTHRISRYALSVSKLNYMLLLPLPVTHLFVSAWRNSEPDSSVSGPGV